MSQPEIAARNTVVLFEPALNREFIRMSEGIAARVKTRIILNDRDMHPHLSLYNVRYPAGNMPRVEETLARIAPALSPFSLTLDRFSATAGYIFLDAQATEEIRSVQERLIAALTDLRDGYFDRTELALPGVTEDMRANLRETGMLLSRGWFQPHVTLSRPDRLEDCAAALECLPRDFSARTTVDRIHLVETGPNGTCRKLLRSFMLGGNGA